MNYGKYIIRPFQPGDEGRLLAFYRTQFNDQNLYTTGYWKWRHEANPCGNSLIRYAESEDGIIGCLEYTPCEIVVDSKPARAGRGGNSVVAPAHRNQGLRIKLRQAIMEEAERQGWLCLLGFPNRLAYGGARKQGGFANICSLTRFVKVLRITALFRAIPSTPKGRPAAGGPATTSDILPMAPEPGPYESGRSSVSIQVDSTLDAEYDEFWQRFTTTSRASVLAKTRAFMQWRYIDNPFFNYTIISARAAGKVVGIAMLNSIMKGRVAVGRIMEILVLPDYSAILPILLREIERYFRMGGTDVIITRLAGNESLKRVLLRQGYIPTPLNRQRFIGLPLEAAGSNSLSAQARWTLMTGDLTSV